MSRESLFPVFNRLHWFQLANVERVNDEDYKPLPVENDSQVDDRNSAVTRSGADEASDAFPLISSYITARTCQNHGE